jgi:hypothetical protein
VSPPETDRDPAGDLKRQAARFRVFRSVRDADRRLLEAVEITLRDARITWTVHPANRKGVARRGLDSAVLKADSAPATRARHHRKRTVRDYPVSAVFAPEGRWSIAKGASPWTAREPQRASLEPRRGDASYWRDEITVAPPGLTLNSFPHSYIPGADAPGY